MQISVIAVEGKGGHKRLQNNTKSARDCKSGGGKLQKLIMQMHKELCENLVTKTQKFAEGN